MESSPTVYLVETIPSDLSELEAKRIGPDTHSTLIRLIEAATSSINVTVMYWSLLAAEPGADWSGFALGQLEALGASAGVALFTALDNAATRGVSIRILQGPGFGYRPEPHLLQERHPHSVAIRSVNPADWYGRGRMHQKVWVFDGKDTYIGSANMDWRSLRQVKELGVVIENDRKLAAAVVQQFDVWWCMSFLDVKSSSVVWDSRACVQRSVPSWSTLLPEQGRAANPLLLNAEATPVSTQLNTTWDDIPVTACVSASPPEFCPAGRATTLDRLLNLIDQAQRFVDLSFMNLVPVEPTPVFAADATSAGNTTCGWSSVADALLNAVQNRGVTVRILVSQWAHTPPETVPAIYQLLRMAAASAPVLAGSLEVRWFVMPGWDATEGAGRNFPGHSRVNHPKFAISESRAFISTNNMTWESFFCNAGISFDTEYFGVVCDLLSVFDRDWYSGYTKHFCDFTEMHMEGFPCDSFRF